MKLINEEEINTIIKQYGNHKVLDFTLSKYSDTLIGYLGEHLRLKVTAEKDGKRSEYKFFVKCMPKEPWLAKYLIESNFFCKEYVMLSDLFTAFDRNSDNKWRPRSLLIKDDIFVLEDAKELGYEMAKQRDTLNHEELKAVVKTLAQFHAQSLIFEEQKSQELGRSYSIWEDYSEYLQEPKDHSWRNAGRNAVIEFLKVHSKRRLEEGFLEHVTELMYSLFDEAVNLMEPNLNFRNTVVHRDLWSNNILLKADKESKTYHALIVDFQTVVFCPPTMDLTSLIYFNTRKDFRDRYMIEIQDYYYEELTNAVENKVANFSAILNKSDFLDSFNESLVFGLTQAAIIVPIIAMSVSKREKLFCDSDSIHKINNVSRSKEILNVAKEDAEYCSRISELFEEIVDRYYVTSKQQNPLINS